MGGKRKLEKILSFATMAKQVKYHVSCLEFRVLNSDRGQQAVDF